MQVTLLSHTPLHTASHAIRTCWQSFDKGDNGGEKDIALIERVGNKLKHSSTLEHLTYTFYIKGVSRALLQELARHRMASMSVKSSRYTLKELKAESPFLPLRADSMERAEKYVVFSSDEGEKREAVDTAILEGLEKLRALVASGESADVAKYALIEAYKTELTWTINARSLQNFLRLRSTKAAWGEIRRLAFCVFEALPAEHKFIFEDCMARES